MGWTGIHLSERGQTRTALTSALSDDGERCIYRPLDIAIVRFSEAYAAVARTDKISGITSVTGVVVLLRYAPKEYYNFAYKDMYEDMGPYYFNCPRRILDRLSPCDELFAKGSVEHVHATQWRESCRAVIRKRAEVTRKGVHLRSDDGIRFSDGIRRHRFTHIGKGRCIAEDGVMVKISERALLDLAVV